MRDHLESYTFKGAGGSHQTHQGIEPANVPWQIYLACADGESINVQTFIALHTTITLSGLYDLLELQKVHATWLDAAQRNAEERAERERLRGK